MNNMTSKIIILLRNKRNFHINYVKLDQLHVKYILKYLYTEIKIFNMLY